MAMFQNLSQDGMDGVWQRFLQLATGMSPDPGTQLKIAGLVLLIGVLAIMGLYAAMLVRASLRGKRRLARHQQMRRLQSADDRHLSSWRHAG